MVFTLFLLLWASAPTPGTAAASVAAGPVPLTGLLQDLFVIPQVLAAKNNLLACWR